MHRGDGTTSAAGATSCGEQPCFLGAWLAVDVVGVPLAFSSGLPFSGLVYIVYFVLVLAGLRSWWLGTRTSSVRGTETARDAVGR